MYKIILNGETIDLNGPTGPDGNPIGTIISFMGTTAPRDYLICDGSIYKISDYPELAEFLKKQFGSSTYFGSNGDGTFAVPDMRNLFLRGYHGEAEEQLSGEIGKKQDGTVFQAIVKSNSQNNIVGYAGNAISNQDSIIMKQGSFRITIDESNATGSTSAVHTSRPVNMAVLYCIKAVKSESERHDEGEVYSTEEIRIGTWIDGKPLYRKIIQTTSPSTENRADDIATIDNMDTLVSLSGYVLTKGNSYADVNYASVGIASQYNIATTMTTSGVVQQVCYYSGYINRPVTLIIEYTKTTDNAVSISAPMNKEKETFTQEKTTAELPDISFSDGSAATDFTVSIPSVNENGEASYGMNVGETHG